MSTATENSYFLLHPYKLPRDEARTRFRQSPWLACDGVHTLCRKVLLLLFLTNLQLTTHTHNVGHSNTNTVLACAVFSLGRASPARQASSESTRKCPKALDVCLKLADVSAANPYWGLS